MKTKMYSNQPRKPMMYGGDSRKKMQSGGDAMANAETQSRVATGQATAKDKEAMQQQRREDLQREIKKAKEDGDKAAIQRFMKASSSPKGDGPIIKGILQEMGMAERAPAPQETSGMMYGGKAK
jgi:hypothetical protein